uniref:Mitochondrial ribosomal protein S22 n=1 Tax=Leptobrachium leishanense TaxID=445787 RepID=A0A8C5PXL8_9ANUR
TLVLQSSRIFSSYLSRFHVPALSPCPLYSLYMAARIGLMRRRRLRSEIAGRCRTRCSGAPRSAAFSDSDVQSLLKKMTGLNLEKIFKPKKQELSPPPTFKLLTETQYQETVQNLEMPPVFSEQLLNRCLIQFDPDSAEYIRVHHARHFGGMAWHLYCTKIVLLIDMIQRDLIEDSVSLIKLYNLLHSDTDCARELLCLEGAELLKIFVKTEAQKPGYIELALQAYQEAASDASSS